MGKKLHLDMAAEQEANDIGRKFMNSTDVVGDMSRAYGADLSAVKIHTDSAAAGMAEQRGVDAFSTGKDVFFARDAFDKNNPESRGLLAHELSHSLQQGVGGGLGGMQQSAPLGAEQGGWLGNLFRRKKKKAEPEQKKTTPAQHLGSRMDYSKEAKEHIRRYRELEMEIDRKNGVNTIAKAIRTPSNLANVHSKSFLERSNEAYRQTKDEGDGRELTEFERRSKALTNLGFRESGTGPATVEKQLRGHIYDKVESGYRDVLAADGLDLDELSSAERRNSSTEANIGGQIDKATFITGGGIEGLMEQAFDLFGQEALSDASLDYLQYMTEGVADAEVFNGQKFGVNGASNFAIQTLINTVGGNFTSITKDPTSSKALKGAALNVGIGIGSLPKLAMMEAKDVPETLRPLRQKYIDLQNQLDEKLKERMKT